MRRRRSALLAAVCLLSGAQSCASGGPCEGGDICLSQKPGTRVALGSTSDALAGADLDGDGRLDVVGADTSAGALTVAWSGGAGAAELRTTWTIDREVGGIAVADLDGDGRLDLATALPGADAVAVLRGRGARSFSAPEQFPAGRAPRSLIAANLDGSGPPELVTADLGGTVTVLRNFAIQPSIVVGPSPHGLAAGDLDGDGDNDLAVALADADAIQLLLGDGAGGLVPGPLHPVGAAPYAVVAADFDDDGALDLATTDTLDDTISVLLADGAGGHGPRRAFPTAPQPASLVAVPDESSRHVLAYLSMTTPVVERLDPRDGATRSTVLASASSALAIAPADAGELVYSDPAGLGTLSPGDGLRAREAWQHPAVTALVAVDLEGDGPEELLAVTAVDRVETVLWRGDPDHAEPLDTGTSTLEGALAGDMTGDGRHDLVVWGCCSLIVLVQQNDGALLPAGPATLYGGELLDLVRIDGSPDLLAVADIDDSTRLSRFTADGAGLLVRTEKRDLPIKAAAAHFVDDDGDAAPDLVLQTDSGFTYYEDSGDIGRVFVLERPFDDDAALDFADVDGDGALDVVGHDKDGITIISAALSDAPGEPLHLSPEPCEALTLADLDGDGALDLLAASTRPNLDDRVLLTPWLRRDDGWTALGRKLVPRAERTQLRFARLDGDPVPDLLLVGGSFEPTRAVPLDLAPSLVDAPQPSAGPIGFRHLADLDGDGADELIAVGNGLGVAFADGRGGFGPLQRRTLDTTFEPGSSIRNSVVGDFDRDGADDLVVGLRAPDVHDLSLVRLSLDSAGDLSHELVSTLPVGIVDLHAADLDGDSRLDLVAIVPVGSLNGLLLRGDGHGRFAPAEFLSASGGLSTWQTRLHDVDRDGHLDVLAIDAPAGTLVYRGRGTGVFDAAHMFAPVSAQAYVPGDFDRDGHTELAVLHPTSGLLLVDEADPAPQVLLQGIDAFAAHDIDGDGHLELIALQNETLTDLGRPLLHISRPRDDGRLGLVRQRVTARAISAIEAGDIDGDGDLDLALLGLHGAEIVRQGP